MRGKVGLKIVLSPPRTRLCGTLGITRKVIKPRLSFRMHAAVTLEHANTLSSSHSSNVPAWSENLLEPHISDVIMIYPRNFAVSCAILCSQHTPDYFSIHLHHGLGRTS